MSVALLVGVRVRVSACLYNLSTAMENAVAGIYSAQKHPNGFSKMYQEQTIIRGRHGGQSRHQNLLVSKKRRAITKPSARKS